MSVAIEQPHRETREQQRGDRRQEEQLSPHDSRSSQYQPSPRPTPSPQPDAGSAYTTQDEAMDGDGQGNEEEDEDERTQMSTRTSDVYSPDTEDDDLDYSQPELETDEVESEEAARAREDRRLLREEVKVMETAIEGLRHYKILAKIGEGTFSSVYRAIDRWQHCYDNRAWLPEAGPRSKTSDSHVALKRIYVTSSPARILNELEIMEDLRDRPSIAYLITAFRTEDQIIMVMPYTRHIDFRDYYRDIDMPCLRSYMRCLFQALDGTHDEGVIHRDVKPANFLFDPRTHTGTLCDFGLAERFDPAEWRGKCHHDAPTPENPRGTVSVNRDVYSIHTEPGGELDPHKKTHVKQAMGPPDKATHKKVERVGYQEEDKRPSVRANRAGTRGFRAPEVLFKCQDQTPGVDVWSAGIILLSFLTRRFPIFNANTDLEALLELMVVFGKTKMERCALLHNRTFKTNVPPENDGWRVPEFILYLNPGIIDPPRGEIDFAQWGEDLQLAIDLCRVCLHVDLTRRWTAAECLDHPFIANHRVGSA